MSQPAEDLPEFGYKHAASLAVLESFTNDTYGAILTSNGLRDHILARRRTIKQASEMSGKLLIQCQIVSIPELQDNFWGGIVVNYFQNPGKQPRFIPTDEIILAAQGLPPIEYSDLQNWQHITVPYTDIDWAAAQTIGRNLPAMDQ